MRRLRCRGVTSITYDASASEWRVEWNKELNKEISAALNSAKIVMFAGSLQNLGWGIHYGGLRGHVHPSESSASSTSNFHRRLWDALLKAPPWNTLGRSHNIISEAPLEEYQYWVDRKNPWILRERFPEKYGIFYGIRHERGGCRVPLTFFFKNDFLNRHLE